MPLKIIIYVAPTSENIHVGATGTAIAAPDGEETLAEDTEIYAFQTIH